MNPYICLTLSLLAGLSTLLGCIFIFIKVKKVGEYIVFSLSISMTIMILISLIDLIPTSLPVIINKYNYLGIIISLLIFILGYLSIYMINKKLNYKDSNLKRIGILSMISLIIHNIPEGIAVFMSSYTNISLGVKLFLAIVLHNIPEGIAISVPLYYGGESRGQVIKKTLISGLSEPIGALFSFLFIKERISQLFLAFILLFVAGLMISLSINDIYKEIKNYNKNKYILYGITTGIIISILLFLL
ncbi:MAG: ZIP family metal transporter [Bacilli bacterium]|nr:ZIP family metal transporter [Bacilli bacterium]